jgi:hypothetical protein
LDAVEKPEAELTEIEIFSPRELQEAPVLPPNTQETGKN